MENENSNSSVTCLHVFTIKLPQNICTGKLNNNAEITVSHTFAIAANFINRSIFELPQSSSENKRELSVSESSQSLSAQFHLTPNFDSNIHMTEETELTFSSNVNINNICTRIEIIFSEEKELEEQEEEIVAELVTLSAVKVEFFWTRERQDYAARFFDRALTRVYPALDPLQYINVDSPEYKKEESSQAGVVIFTIRPSNVLSCVYRDIVHLTHDKNAISTSASFLTCITSHNHTHITTTTNNSNLVTNTNANNVVDGVRAEKSADTLTAWRSHTVEDYKCTLKECINAKDEQNNYKLQSMPYINKKKEPQCTENCTDNTFIENVDTININNTLIKNWYNNNNNNNNNNNDDDLWRRARAANSRNNCNDNEDVALNNKNVKFQHDTEKSSLYRALSNIKCTWRVARLMAERVINGTNWAIEEKKWLTSHKKRLRNNVELLRYSNIIDATIALHERATKHSDCKVKDDTPNKIKWNICTNNNSSTNNFSNNKGEDNQEGNATRQSTRECRLTHVDGCGIEFSATVVGYTHRYTYLGVPCSVLERMLMTITYNDHSHKSNKITEEINKEMPVNCNAHCETKLHNNNDNNSSNNNSSMSNNCTIFVIARIPHPSWFASYNKRLNHTTNNNYTDHTTTNNKNNALPHPWCNYDKEMTTMESLNDLTTNKATKTEVKQVNNEVSLNKTIALAQHQAVEKIHYRLLNLQRALLFDNAKSFVRADIKLEYSCILRAHRVSCEYISLPFNICATSKNVGIWFDEVYLLSSWMHNGLTDNYETLLSLIKQSCTRYNNSLLHFTQSLANASDKGKLSKHDECDINRRSMRNCEINKVENCSINKTYLLSDVEVQILKRANRLFDMMDDTINVWFKKVKTQEWKRRQAKLIPIVNTCRDIEPLREGCCVEFKHHLQSDNTTLITTDISSTSSNSVRAGCTSAMPIKCSSDYFETSYSEENYKQEKISATRSETCTIGRFANSIDFLNVNSSSMKRESITKSNKRAIMDVERIRNTMSAMASTLGGIILIGVADDGTVCGYATNGDKKHINEHNDYYDVQQQLRLTGFCPAMVKDSITSRQLRVLTHIRLPLSAEISLDSTYSEPLCFSPSLTSTKQQTKIKSEAIATNNVTCNINNNNNNTNITTNTSTIYKMPPNWWKLNTSATSSNCNKESYDNNATTSKTHVTTPDNKVVTVIYVNKGQAPFYRNSRRSMPYWRTCASTTTMPISAMINRLFVALC